MKVKKIILSIIAILIIVSSLYIIVNGKNYRYEASNKINIVSSNFASYDFLRAIIGEYKINFPSRTRKRCTWF